MGHQAMPLVLLSPEFIRHGESAAGLRLIKVVDRAEAEGVSFLCPKCFQRLGGAVGCHRVMCWDPSVPADVSPGPGRWKLDGRGFDDLSLVAGSSSVALQGGCKWHGFVRAGLVTDAEA
jgi:hypothetical protein